MPEGLLYIYDRIEPSLYLVVTACVFTQNLKKGTTSSPANSQSSYGEPD